MTYRQIMDKLLGFLEKEKELDRFTEADRENAVQQAYRQITEENRLYTRTLEGDLATFTDTANQYQYIPFAPDDYLALHADGVFVNGRRLRPVTLPDALAFDPKFRSLTGFRAGYSEPLYYLQDSDAASEAAPLGITVLPRSSMASLAFTLRYTARPVDLSDATPDPWNGRWDAWTNCIPLLAASMLMPYKGAGFYQSSRYFLAEYEREVEKLQRAKRRQTRKPTRLKVGYQR
jgi:hypothetical protein